LVERRCSLTLALASASSSGVLTFAQQAAALLGGGAHSCSTTALLDGAIGASPCPPALIPKIIRFRFLFFLSPPFSS